MYKFRYEYAFALVAFSLTAFYFSKRQKLDPPKDKSLIFYNAEQAAFRVVCSHGVKAQKKINLLHLPDEVMKLIPQYLLGIGSKVITKEGLVGRIAELPRKDAKFGAQEFYIVEVETDPSQEYETMGEGVFQIPKANLGKVHLR